MVGDSFSRTSRLLREGNCAYFCEHCEAANGTAGLTEQVFLFVPEYEKEERQVSLAPVVGRAKHECERLNHLLA